MCGILGFNFSDKKLLERGLRAIKHRGPDGSGKYSDKFISLGHNRLSIIDLTDAGKQPMSNENEDIWITFNGEIYNYEELKKGLKRKHNFKSDTDTEVLLYLYEENGFEMLNKLQGMFAFCIYDSKRKILFLARDRVGKKPLYYYQKDKRFIFSSEIKGILEEEDIQRKLNQRALQYYLAFRANTSNETFFEGINKLGPGCFMVYDLKANNAIIRKYWDINPAEQGDFSERSYSEELYELLKDSVRSRLISDVPYGAYLSGGIDSGTVVSLMSQFSSKPIKTFSVGFEEEKEGETNEAKFLAEKMGTDHHELLIDRSSVKHLPDIINHLDEPMCDPTSIPIYLLSRYAKRYCTVILTGEGADEVFAGYPQYKFMKMHDRVIRKMPNFARKSIPLAAKSAPSFILNKGFRFASSLGKKGIERFENFVMSNRPEEQYLNQVAIFNEEEQSELLGKKLYLYTRYEKYFDMKNDVVTNSQILDFKGNMVEDLLMKVDKNAMAFGVEGRAPFLDYRVVELAFRMPNSLKLKGFSQDKYILRKMAAIKKLVPKETGRRKKRHFFVPIDEWFKDELLPLKEELLSRAYLSKQNLFNANYIEKMNAEWKESRLFYSRQLWALLNFQIWHKQFIENEKIKI